jgi:flagellar biosynthesis/type III secretory pathway M-ring protein FliF/YscJ
VRVHAEYTSIETEHRDTRRAPLGDAITRTVANEGYQGAGRTYHKDEEHDDRGSDTSEVVSHSAAGSISRIDTAVFLDEAHAANIASVRELAAASVGFDAHRGDTLSVAAIDFHRAPAERHDLWYLAYGVLTPLLPTVAVVVGLFFLVRAGLPHISDLAKTYFERHAVAQTSKVVAGYAPAQVRGALAHEPPHAAAAIISALPAATAAAVLELYPPHEREAIVARMQRAHSPHVPSAAEIFGHRA